MTYKETRQKFINDQSYLTQSMNLFAKDYVDGLIEISTSINGWVDIKTENLITTLYSSDSITEMSITPKNCGTMTIDALIELKAQLKLEEKWIRQAYLAIRYFEDQEHQAV